MAANSSTKWLNFVHRSSCQQLSEHPATLQIGVLIKFLVRLAPAFCGKNLDRLEPGAAACNLRGRSFPFGWPTTLPVEFGDSCYLCLIQYPSASDFLRLDDIGPDHRRQATNRNTESARCFICSDDTHL